MGVNNDHENPRATFIMGVGTSMLKITKLQLNVTCNIILITNELNVGQSTFSSFTHYNLILFFYFVF